MDALRKQGWTISATTRRLDHDRKTIGYDMARANQPAARPSISLLLQLPDQRSKPSRLTFGSVCVRTPRTPDAANPGRGDPRTRPLRR